MAGIWRVAAATCVRTPAAGLAVLLLTAGSGVTAAPAIRPALPTCKVMGPAKFVERIGGATALCQRVVRTVSDRVPGAHRIALAVPSSSRMAASVRLPDGRSLPTIRTAVADGTINGGVVDRFAQEIANQISRTLTPQH